MGRNNRALARLKKKTTTEMLWPYFLKLLTERPMCGYEIMQEMKKRFGWKPPTVTSYIVLHNLNRAGYVVSEWKGKKSGPAKRQYVITEAGRKLLKEGLEYLKSVCQSLS
ncbi:MAG: PadR family transcriptional regulator [Candidatus Hadarchaeales archaeon]